MGYILFLPFYYRRTAETMVEISENDKKLIFQTKKSLLYNDGQPWAKKGNKPFDITMGSFDGAEVCELVGLFLLHKLRAKGVKDVGLYRDDGLGALKLTPRQMEQTKKIICSVFEEYGLKVTIEANKKTVDFLDVTFDLTLGTYKPYSKPKTKHLYIHTKSNYPPGILKNLKKYQYVWKSEAIQPKFQLS